MPVHILAPSNSQWLRPLTKRSDRGTLIRMHVIEVVAAFLLLLLVLTKRTNGFVSHTEKTASNIFLTFTKYVAGIAYVQGRPANTMPIGEFRAVQKEQFESLMFIATSPFYIPILVFGILACVPAPAPTQELAMLVPLLMSFFLLLLFLLQYLLHVGAENASYEVKEYRNTKISSPRTISLPYVTDNHFRPPRFLA